MLREHRQRFHRIWLIAHVGLVVLAFALATSPADLRTDAARTAAMNVQLALLVGACALIWPWLLSRLGIYESQRREMLWAHTWRLIAAHALAAPALLGVTAVGSFGVSPRFAFMVAAYSLGLHFCLHLPAFLLLHGLRRAGRNFRNVLVVGAGPRARRAMETVRAHPEWGCRIIGFVDDGANDFVPSVPHERICKYVDVPHILRERTVDEVLVACPRSMLGSLAPVVDECASIGVPVTLLTDLFGDCLPLPQVGHLAHMGTLTFAPVHHAEIELLFKRVFDVVAASAGLILTAPIVGLAMLAIRWTSGSPVLFRQLRCGRYGRHFDMLKLRTMVVDAEERKAELIHLNELDGPVFKIRNDPRVTRVGRVLRKWSIDELPQLWNVVIGDMSLVGPRPPTPDEVEQYRGAERRRLSMRPGITCLWQISGRNEIRFEDWVKLDLEYIDSWSFFGDILILFRTLPQVLLARGAS